MKDNIFNKFHTALVFLSFSVIIILSVLMSFAGSGFIPKVVKSPFYIIPWLILAVLIIVYPWLNNSTDKTLLSYFIKHIPFILLFFAVFIAMMTNRNVEYSLSEGEIVNLNDLKSSLLFKKDMNIDMRLDDFSIERHSKKDKSVKSYKSEITLSYNDSSKINAENSSVRKIIEVNKPFKIDNLSIYQKSWTLGIREIRFKINNAEYEITEQKDKIIKVKDNEFFEIYPSDIIGKKILYKWNIKNENSLLLDTGFFINEKDFNNKYPSKVYIFRLLKEDFKLISIFEITHRRSNLFLAFAAVLFILTMFMDFFGYKTVKKLIKTKQA